MDLHEFGPDERAAVGTFVAIENAVSAADARWEHPQTPYRREMAMRHGWDGEVGRHFLAEVDGRPVGGLVVHTSEYDNLDLAWLALDVHPDRRRRGHGTAILDAA